MKIKRGIIKELSWPIIQSKSDGEDFFVLSLSILVLTKLLPVVKRMKNIQNNKRITKAETFIQTLSNIW